MSPSVSASTRLAQRSAAAMPNQPNYLNYDYPFESVEGYLFTALSDQAPLDQTHTDASYPGQQYQGISYLDPLTSESQSPAGSLYDGLYPEPPSQFLSASPTPEQADEPSPAVQKPKPAPKRKRVNRYKNASPETVERRRDQNRTAQQHYRQRKENLIGDLKNQVEAAAKENKTLQTENTLLKVRLANSEANCRALAAAHGPAITLNMPMPNHDDLGIGAFGYPHVGQNYLSGVSDPGGQIMSTDGWHTS